MGVARRMFPLEDISTVLEFWIDTRIVVAGATDGSENPNTFRLPLNFPTNPEHIFIIRVNDGRPDYVYPKTDAGSIITVNPPGIYKCTLIGKSNIFSFGPSAVDRRKMIYLDRLGSSFRGLTTSAFQNYSNLIYRVSNTVKLTGARNGFFEGIKGFPVNYDLSKLDVSEVTNFGAFFQNIQQPLYSTLNPFMNQATSLIELYRNVDLSNVPKIEIISPTVTTLNYMLGNTNFRGELIIKAPIISYFGLLNGVTNPPSLGKLDVRKANNFGSWIMGTMTQANVDSTLLGWVNNFDWTNTEVIARTVTFGTGAKYSNNAAVIAAKQFLESKGFTFSSLTMAV